MLISNSIFLFMNYIGGALHDSQLKKNDIYLNLGFSAAL